MDPVCLPSHQCHSLEGLGPQGRLSHPGEADRLKNRPPFGLNLDTSIVPESLCPHCCPCTTVFWRGGGQGEFPTSLIQALPPGRRVQAEVKPRAPRPRKGFSSSLFLLYEDLFWVWI